VCGHPIVEPVCGANLVRVTEEHLDTRGLVNSRVPVCVGPARPMLDSEGHDATAVDVLFHPSVLKRALLGGKSVTKEHYRDYLMDIAEKNIAEEHAIVCAPGRRVVLGVAKYKGPNGENKDKTHAFPVFPPETESGEDAFAENVNQKALALEARKKEPPTSLPENGEKQKDAPRPTKATKPIKKGFLFPSGGADASLYPNGSAEGIPKPGEQFDPLGHIPENIRKTCHVIDSGALRGADFERVTKQYAETGRLDTSAPGVYVKGSEPGSKPEKVGMGHPIEKKMENTSAASCSGKRDTEKPKLVPEHVTNTNDESVEIVVRLPLLVGGMSSVELETGETSCSLTSPEYELTVILPKHVDPNGTTAKFSAKRKTLTVVLPVAR
jgi:hypothetical protein